ncbi:MAG: NADH-quinone oxidoreductase subunit G, partial [Actinobacteria bacterium]|nr:NADH-quinone oxidoreductase subunit G [Actinomycetota bacterium]
MERTRMSDVNDTEVQETPVVVKTTLSITVDGRAHEAEPGQLLIDACEDAGSYVPRFCYHPRMEPVGMCRQCLVEVEGPRGPMMVVSCMTPVAEGQVARTETPSVKRAQEGVLELLLANHPLDCPVCDKGGECPLQDQAFSHGPGESRFVEEKRHYEKPIPISDLVFLDRERCILCDRCTRFADEVAGDPLISFTQRGNNTQVNTFPDEPFASYFSGNTVQICPVGALTAKPYRFKARPWDLEQRESTCTTCSVGCRTVIQSSRDELLRYQGSDSDAVNWGWLCDKGRFNFENVNSEDRLEQPLMRDGSNLVPSTWSQASAAVAEALKTGTTAILGGARGTNEDAFAWARLADALGIQMRDPQLSDGLPTEVFGLPSASIEDAANATTIIVIAPDLKEELPVLYLRLRDAAEKRRSRILEFTAVSTGLTKYSWKSVPTEPGLQASTVRNTLGEATVREQLGKGNVVVVVGRASLAESADHTVAALSAVLAEVPGAKVLPVVRRGNVRGAVAAGLGSNTNATEILTAAAAGKLD